MPEILVRPQPASPFPDESRGWLRRLTTALALYRRRRAGLRALRELDARLLHDIGLEPFELRAAAWTGRSMRSTGSAEAHQPTPWRRP